MGTTAAGTTIHPIYWAPGGYGFQSGFTATMNKFIADVSAGSGSAINVFGAITQYYQRVGGVKQNIRYRVTAGAEQDDTNRYPSGGCRPDTGAGFVICLTDAQVGAELANYTSAKRLRAGLADQYSIFFPPKVEICFDNRNAAQGGGCASGTPKAGFCAFHTARPSGTTALIYAVMPYVTYCSVPSRTPPNGSSAAQEQATVVAHEALEAMTDPVFNGWIDGKGQEVGDMCVGFFVDQTFGSHQWSVQEVFSNADYSFDPVLGGCTTTLKPSSPFKPLPGSATDISVGARGGLWIIGTDTVPGGHGVYNWTGTGWSTPWNGAITIAVGVDGLPWVIDSAHRISHLTRTGWTPYPGTATDISVGANGAVWIIGTDTVAGGHSIYRWTGTHWAGSGGAVKVAVGPDGSPWVINSAHHVSHLTRTGWTTLPGTATDISVGANGGVWIIGTDTVAGGHSIYRWTGTRWAAPPGGAVSIAVAPNGVPLIITQTHHIYLG
jgi:hypothetical protein